MSRGNNDKELNSVPEKEEPKGEEPESEELLPPSLPREIIESLPPDLPPEDVERITHSVSSFMMRMGPMAPPAPFWEKKLTTAHIDKILDYSEKESIRESTDTSSKRRYGLGGIITALVFIVFLVVYLTQIGKDSLLTNLLNLILGFFAGLAGGFGLAKHFARNSQG